MGYFLRHVAIPAARDGVLFCVPNTVINPVNTVVNYRIPAHSLLLKRSPTAVVTILEKQISETTDEDRKIQLQRDLDRERARREKQEAANQRAAQAAKYN